MSANPTWQASLVRSSDRTEIGRLAYSFTFTPVFNRPGSLSMTLPLDDEIAYSVVKHATAISCERNDSVKWSGEIVSVSKDPDEMKMTISALGWLDQLNQRFVHAEDESLLIFTDKVGGEIAQALIGVINLQQDTDGIARPTALVPGPSYDTQIRTRAYKRGQGAGQAVQELSDVENGFDIRVNPVTLQVSTYPPTSYRDLTDIVFGYKVEPFNLANAPESDDGSSTAQRITVVGSNGIAFSADDGVAINAQGGFMRESWLSISDVSDANVIGAYANAELVYQRYGRQTYDLKPKAYGNVHRLYDDFELGDQVYLSVDAGAYQLERRGIRIFSVTLEVDAQGNEVITQIATAPQ